MRANDEMTGGLPPELPPSFWRETFAPPPPAPLAGDLEVDVAIVGGGFTGLHTALELVAAQPGLRVAVLEGAVIGYGASGRNAGFAMTLFGFDLAATAWRFGKAAAGEIFGQLRAAVQGLARRVEAERIDCDLERTGMLVVANSPRHWRRLERELELARRCGITTFERWDRERLRREVRSPLLWGARFDPDCALVNPWKLVHGLRSAAERRGVQVCELAPVRRLEERADGVALETPRGVVRAARAVLATNAYGAWLGALDRLAVPVFTYIVITEPLAAEQLETIGWQGRQGIEDARNLIHYYRLTADNRLLIGGGAVRYRYGGQPTDPRHATDWGIAVDLRHFVYRIFPCLREVRFEYHWGGPVSVPLDMAPAVGRIGAGARVFYAVGCVGHGVATSLLQARVLADLVLGRDSPLVRLPFVDRRLVPFPPEPLRYALAHSIRGALVLGDVWLDRGRAR